MLNVDVYAIYTMDDERTGSIKELFFSFEEAMANRFHYANWFADSGDISIELYKANSKFRCSHTWKINPDGSIREEFPF